MISSANRIKLLFWLMALDTVSFRTRIPTCGRADSHAWKYNYLFGSIGRGPKRILHCLKLNPPLPGLVFAVASASPTPLLSGSFCSGRRILVGSLRLNGSNKALVCARQLVKFLKE